MVQQSCWDVELDLEVLAYFLDPLSPHEGTPDILGMLGCSLGSRVLWGKEALTCLAVWWYFFVVRGGSEVGYSAISPTFSTVCQKRNRMCRISHPCYWQQFMYRKFNETCTLIFSLTRFLLASFLTLLETLVAGQNLSKTQQPPLPPSLQLGQGWRGLLRASRSCPHTWECRNVDWGQMSEASHLLLRATRDIWVKT